MTESVPRTDPLAEPQPPRFLVGIDLGTTNSALAYVDTHVEPWRIEDFPVLQFVAAGEVDRRAALPSFHFQPPGEASQLEQHLRLPWQRRAEGYCVGVYARDEGALLSGRQIASAKSWLCHAGVDRTAKLLPWHSAEDVERLSPVDASAAYLKHFRQAWDASFPGHPLADQDVVLTLPASFDEIARELTIAAARAAGLPRVTLIEEPQAAFYAWVVKHQGDWMRHVSPGDTILVCDIGGGTTDFTLIRVRESAGAAGPSGQIQFHRVAVGNHLILGGDNLDLALARCIESRWVGEQKLSARQWDLLVGRCRQMKEDFCGDRPPERWTLHLAGSGASVISGGLRADVTREEVLRLLLDGFLPWVGLDDRPAARPTGLREFGLPYAADPAITRNLAAFLSTHRNAGREASDVPTGVDSARPSIVLFNGGFFASRDFRERLIAVIESWFRTPDDPTWTPRVLDHDRLDLAVCRGAAYYGMVRRGVGVRITASLARSYYLGIETEPPSAICLIPGSAEAGQSYDLRSLPLQLAVGHPVEFPLWVSSVRLADAPGSIVPIDPEQFTAMPPLRTVIRAAKRKTGGEIPVFLRAGLTEIGTLDLWCHAVTAEQEWKLQFDVRSATQTDRAAHESRGEKEGVLDESLWDACQVVLASVFDERTKEPPNTLARRLAETMEQDRSSWPMSFLRRVVEALLELADGRRKSVAHESRWLNLLGYAMRPGYGYAVDDWRVHEIWRTVFGKLAFHAPEIRTESLILWRRVAGGLTAGQQAALAEPGLALVRGWGSSSGKGKGAATLGGRPEESAEMWRLLGSLELLPVRVKREIAEALLACLPRPRFQNVRPALIWALGRLGQRVPVYGPLNTVIPPEFCEPWIRALLPLHDPGPEEFLAMMQLTRKCDDRYLDVSRGIRDQAVAWLQGHKAPPHLELLVREGGGLEEEEQSRVFGESLPKGLRIA